MQQRAFQQNQLTAPFKCASHLGDKFLPTSWCCRVDTLQTERIFPPHQKKKVSQLKTSATYPQKANFELPYGHVDFPKVIKSLFDSVASVSLSRHAWHFFLFKDKRETQPLQPTHWPSTFSCRRALVRTAATSGKVFQSKSLNTSACGLSWTVVTQDRPLSCNTAVQFQWILLNSKVVWVFL